MRRKKRKGQQRASQTKTTQEKAGLNGRKIFLLTLAVGVTGGAAYLAYDYLKKKKSNAQLPSDTTDRIIINNNLPASYTSVTTSTSSKSSTANDSFPLKQGSKGPRVAQLQQALDSILGAGSMAKKYGGIDGIFGPGTANALKSAGYGTVIDEGAFNKIVGINSLAVTFSPSDIAKALYGYARSQSLYSILATLKKINSPTEYSEVNEYYKKIPLVSRTIVTDLLEYTFKADESAKEQIKNEFLRMGLKVDSSGRWSLSGFGARDVITLRETYVLDRLSNRIPVRASTILGEPVRTSNGMTWFRSVDNSMLQVPTQDIKYTN